MKKRSLYKTDFLVIGSGIAGLTFAREMAESGKVTILTKKDRAASNTNFAQGGIACVLDPLDSFEAHIRDTLTVGAGLCHEDMVRIMVEEGPGMIRKLIEWGTQFNWDPERNLYDLGREGGHSHRRVIHSEDLTGREIERALLSELLNKENVEIHEHEVCFEILTHGSGKNRRCIGVRSIERRTECVNTWLAGAVLLCTGGLGRVYLHTTNPEIATGDGVAMAFRIGCPVANMEFIQFHPTSFYNPGGETFLISEAVRGEGGVLKRVDGATFMENYHEMACLAPRDVVARAIDREMKLSGDPHVLLDCTHLDSDFIRGRFPNIDRLCLDNGIDFTRKPIPVVPAAHYACGGVITDENAATTLDGLFATGEVSHTGVHGANRLASNSLLEALIFSHRAALKIQANREKYRVDDSMGEALPEDRHLVSEDLEAVRVAHCREEVVRFMWDYVGIVRSTERLNLAKERATLIRKEVEDYISRGYLSPGLAELWNMAEVADLIITSAIRRKESRGLHYNIDYPETDDRLWKRDTLLQK